MVSINNVKAAAADITLELIKSDSFSGLKENDKSNSEDYFSIVKNDVKISILANIRNGYEILLYDESGNQSKKRSFFSFLSILGSPMSQDVRNFQVENHERALKEGKDTKGYYLSRMKSDFDFLKKHYPEIFTLGKMPERIFKEKG
ncbi:MAG: hypothetical protein Crog4KO_26290 [Crocinitomicaceae bacterium]